MRNRFDSALLCSEIPATLGEAVRNFGPCVLLADIRFFFFFVLFDKRSMCVLVDCCLICTQ